MTVRREPSATNIGQKEELKDSNFFYFSFLK